MRFVTVDELKHQMNVDMDWHGDDAYIEAIGTAAEDMVEQLVNTPLEELVASEGELPPTIKHAIKIVSDYFYAVQRGSNANDGELPESVYTMLKLFRNFQ